MSLNACGGAALVGLLILWPVAAQAQCTGSGLTWNCPAGTTPGQVNTAITNATDGATITFATGSYTWGGGNRIQVAEAKAVTLICAVEAQCDVTTSTQVFDWPDSSSSSKCYRISGFEFTDTAGNTTILYDPQDSGTTDILTSCFRVDHNIFNSNHASSNIIMWSLSTSAGHSHVVYGVADHNTFNYTSAATKAHIDFNFGTLYVAATGGAGDSALNSWGGSLGDSENFFVEDNTFNVPDDATNPDCTDATGLQGVVVRFNTAQNCRFVFHGTLNSSGPSNIEMYANAMTFTTNWAYGDPGFHALHMQGAGTNGVWGNNLTDATSTSIILIQSYTSGQPDPPPQGSGDPYCGGPSSGVGPAALYLMNGNRSPEATYHFYPCFHMPGRDYTTETTAAAFKAAFYPVFAFLNVRTNTGAKEDIIITGQGACCDPDYTGSHLVANRDVYNAVSANAQSSSSSPFNGTTGIGHGTLANRPTTCTVASDSDVGEDDEGRSGVMYWATDQGSWNTSSSNSTGVQRNGADGVLYMCTATNTWSTYYTPYTYPHPLNTGSVGGGSGSGSRAPRPIRRLVALVTPSAMAVALLMGTLCIAGRRRRGGRPTR